MFPSVCPVKLMLGHCQRVARLAGLVTVLFSCYKINDSVEQAVIVWAV